MDIDSVAKKRKVTQDEEPIERQVRQKDVKESSSDDERSTEKVVFIQETPLRLLIRCVLFLVIFSILFYFLSPHEEIESQEDRIERVLIEEKLRHMQIPFPNGVRRR